MFNFNQLPPPPAYVNNRCTTKGYQRFFKLFYVNCRGDLSPCNNDSELGRSLTEMLGTLAVMGVLTIGGIAGFNYAMDKSKANDILDGINKRAIALSTYTLLGTNITASSLSAEFPNKIGDSTVAVAAEGDGFNLTVSGVSDSVCDKVLDTGLKMASKISLGETMVWNGSAKSDHACAEENTITFAFNAAFDNTMTCGYCQHAENNTCVADETCDNGCPGDKPMKTSSETCVSCASSFGYYINATECAHCSNRLMDTDGVCVSCSHGAVYNADAAECAKCPNRFRTTDGYCRACDTNVSYVADATECAKCPNREMLDGKCAPICTEGQFRSLFGACVSCSNGSAYLVNATECAKCPNREMLDGSCVKKICSDEEFRNIYASCVSCSNGSGGEADATECAKCPNRFRTTDGYCHVCDTSLSYVADATECAKCSNREMVYGKCRLKCSEGQFRPNGGDCISCGNFYSYDADATECAKCSQREMRDGECVLK